MDFTDMGVINFKPQISSFYEVLIRCSRTGLLTVRWECDQLFREDIFIEKLGVLVNIPVPHRTSHHNTRVALIDKWGVNIYDGDILTVEMFRGGKKEDVKYLYSEFAIIPYDKIKEISIRPHDTYTYMEVETKFGAHVRSIVGQLGYIPANRVLEMFKGTPAENLVKVK
ncbi:hypothetical protein [Metallosphaera hakonensis]|nr:hypothetical protein [Metallosphaera hakonensis]AWR98628.2 hypothetical protein DFR87_01700 [Metallosphaera hakonensis JCM 8857 = DSM 7519]